MMETCSSSLQLQMVMPSFLFFAGIKRTQDDLLSSLGRGRRQSRVEPNTHVAGHSAEIQVNVCLCGFV